MMEFLEGLNPILMRDATGVVPPATFDEAVKRAYKFEDINNQIKQDRKQHHQQNQRQLTNKKPRQEQQQARPGCGHCGKNNETVVYRKAIGACFRCGALDHAVRDCPQLQNQGNRNQQQRQAAPQAPAENQARQPQQQQQQGRQQAQNQNARPPLQQQNRNVQGRQNRPQQQGRAYHLNRVDANAAGDAVEGKLLICGLEAQILFDPGSTHSFLSPMFAKMIAMPFRELEYILTVTTLVGKQVVYRTYYPSCSVLL